MNHGVPRAQAAIERGMDQRRHVGAQLFASRDGESVADLALGIAREGVSMRPDTLQCWISATKPVMSVAIAQLWERGALAPDDPACLHVPEFGTRGKHVVSLRHLLTHTAGFRFTPIAWSQEPFDDIVAQACDAALEEGWVPGQDCGYHVASAWYVLAEVVRRVDGRHYSQYVRDAIFEPLGMRDSWIGMPRQQHAAYGDRVACMWETEGGECKASDNWAWNGSAQGCGICRPGGSGWGPARELAILYEALLAGGERAGARILTPQSIEAISTRHTVGMLDRTFDYRLDRGLGVVVDSKTYGTRSAWFGTRCSTRAYGHAGYNATVAFADPEYGLAVALVFNGVTDPVLNDERVIATLDGLYEDLELAAPQAREQLTPASR